MPGPRHEAAHLTKATAYTVLVSDDVLLATAAMTFTLPAASACYAGQKFQIINNIAAGGLITLAPNGTDTINGANSNLATLTALYGRHIVESDGSAAWYVSFESAGAETRTINWIAGGPSASAALFTAPNDGTTWQVLAVSARFTTASSSGTLNVEVAGAGIAIASGVNQLTSTISLAGTANTTANGTITGSTSVAAGTSVNAILGGTLTNLAGLIVTITLKRLL